MAVNILIHKDMKKLTMAMEILTMCLIQRKSTGINMRGKNIEVMQETCMIQLLITTESCEL